MDYVVLSASGVCSIDRVESNQGQPMKRVETFLKLSPPVLDYQTPQPPKRAVDRFLDWIEPLEDLVGGRGCLLLIATISCIGIAVSLPGPIGATLGLIGAVLTRVVIGYWAKSSRW
jgi:hypothetical protein